MTTHPNGWPDEALEVTARAINEHDRDAPEWDDAGDEWHEILRAEAGVVLAALAPFLAALVAEARAKALEEAAARIMPTNDPSDWTEYAHINAEAAAAIRALREARDDQ